MFWRSKEQSRRKPVTHAVQKPEHYSVNVTSRSLGYQPPDHELEAIIYSFMLQFYTDVDKHSNTQLENWTVHKNYQNHSADRTG